MAASIMSNFNLSPSNADCLRDLDAPYYGSILCDIPFLVSFEIIFSE